ncbi:hypothetical protein ACFC1L_41345 [Streptomyces sp. NPDC056210]|uniref:hypothetical protein n=1 Tax=Streptomyces sp. NPDC056210 TaxID=3345746 RepID=UPI0035DA4E47
MPLSLDLDDEGLLRHPLLAEAPGLCFWRALTDNDKSRLVQRRLEATGLFSVDSSESSVVTVQFPAVRPALGLPLSALGVLVAAAKRKRSPLSATNCDCSSMPPSAPPLPRTPDHALVQNDH